MSYASQFRGVRRVNALFGQTATYLAFPAAVHGSRIIQPGSTSTGYQNILSVSGRGALTFAATRNGSGSSISATTRITIDGRVILTAAGTFAGGSGLCHVGSVVKSYDASNDIGAAIYREIPFTTSLLIEINLGSSTNAFSVFCAYEVDV